jgi:hypothetical protein
MSTLVQEEKWRAFDQAVDHSARLRDRTKKFVSAIGKLFGQSDVNQRVGLQVQAVDEDGDIAANIATPFGKGRLSLQWAVPTEDAIAIVVVERQSKDQYGRDLWQPVWHINIPPYDDPYVGEGQDRLRIPLSHGHGQDLAMALYKTGMSICYLIATGPQTE